MRALWLEDGILSLRRDVARPQPPEGEALVRVLRAGICSTDHGLVRGLYPFRGVLGHEFVGVVEEGPSELRGRRVVGEINATCGRCSACRAGRSRHCSARTVLGIVGRDGAFADWLSLPIENLHTVPDGVSDAAAVLTEPIAAALRISEQGLVGPCDRVLVVGDGKLGLVIAQVLSLTGCDLLALGRHETKLAHLAAVGIPVTTDPTKVKDGSFDVAIEATGNEDGYRLARAALRPEGTLVLKSTYPGSPTVDATMLVVDEISVVGSRCGPFAPALRLLAQGRIDTAPLEGPALSFDEALAAFELSRRRDTLKVHLMMD